MTTTDGVDTGWVWIVALCVVVFIILLGRIFPKLREDPLAKDEPEFLEGEDEDGCPIKIDARTGEITPLDKPSQDGVHFE